MNADCTFIIGTTHTVCQDYAIALNHAKGSYVVVSDGCSTSPATDIGSRLMVQAGSQALLNVDQDFRALHKSASGQALHWAQTIGLLPQSADATLLTVYCDGQDLIISASGDGVLILESRSGTRDVISISYPSGFPLYPTYAHQRERLDTWRANERAYKEVRHFRAASTFELVETSTSTNLTEVFRLPASDYLFAGVLSDGVNSFYKTEETATSRQTTSIPMEQVVAEILSFKSFAGAFVKRRAKKFANACAARGWCHADDLAIGAIYLGP
jgi:hypothetical protein